MKNRVDLTQMAESVQTEADSLRFAKALLADWEDEEAYLKANPLPPYSSLPNGWESGTIGQFLEAMIAWADDVDHSRRYDAPPDWGLFASMLLAGTPMLSRLVSVRWRWTTSKRGSGATRVPCSPTSSGTRRHWQRTSVP